LFCLRVGVLTVTLIKKIKKKAGSGKIFKGYGFKVANLLQFA